MIPDAGDYAELLRYLYGDKAHELTEEVVREFEEDVKKLKQKSDALNTEISLNAAIELVAIYGELDITTYPDGSLSSWELDTEQTILNILTAWEEDES